MRSRNVLLWIVCALGVAAVLAAIAASLSSCAYFDGNPNTPWREAVAPVVVGAGATVADAAGRCESKLVICDTSNVCACFDPDGCAP